MKKKYLILFSAVVFIVLTTTILFSLFNRNNQDPVELLENKLPEPNYLFDIQIDSLEVIQRTIGRNQFIADILMQYNVEYPKIEYLTREFRSTFDVKRIKAGNNYFMMLGNDSLRKPLYFVYEINAADYVVYSLGDSLYAYKGSKPVQTKVESAHGIITSSLWNTMIGNGYEADLAIKMSDVYAWSIDFLVFRKTTVSRCSTSVSISMASR